MAVAQPSPEPLLKSQPDVTKMNGFSGHTVTVTKHQAARGTAGQLVVPTQPMELKAILALQASLPMSHGPGYYKFTVADSGGGVDDAWMVKLGPELQEVSSMPGPTAFTPAPGTMPLGPGVTDLGHGFFYNEILSTLTTPWRTIVNWKPGEPMPEAPASGGNPRLSIVPPNASPWSWPQPGQQQPAWGNWGGYPATSSESDELKTTRAALDKLERQRELDQIRDENRRREDEQRRREEERDRRMETLIEKLSAKPAGPSEAEQRLERALADEKRQREETDRENRRREEDRRAEEVRRTEMREMRETTDRAIRDATANKSDPMVGVLTQMVQNIQASATETVRTIKDTVAQGAASAERFMMHPTQILDMVRSEKAGASDAMRTVLDTSKEMMTLQKDVFSSLLEQAGGSGQPAWVGLASEAMQKVGAIGQALAERNAREQAQAQYTPPRPPMPQRRPQQAQQAAPQQQRAPQQQQRPQVVSAPTGRPGLMDTGSRPEGTAFDAAAEEFVLADGGRIKQTVVEREGWKKALAELARARGQHQAAQQVQQQEPTTGPMAGAANGAGQPMAAAPAAAQGKRGGGRKKTQAAPPPPVVAPELPPPANPSGYTLAEMVGVDPVIVREAVAPLADEVLFGDLMQAVGQIRAGVNTLTPEAVASYILQGKAFLDNSGKSAPAMDLLAAEQLEVLVYRLAPDTSPEYQDAIVQALAEAMGLASGDDEEEEPE